MRALLIAAAVGLAGCASSADAPLPECRGLTSPPTFDAAAVEAQFHERSRALLAAEKAQDAEAAVQYYAADAMVFSDGSSPLQGRAKIRETYALGWQQANIVSFDSEPDEVRISGAGDIALDRGWNRAVYELDGKEVTYRSRYLAVWERERGEWFLTRLSITRMEPVSPPADRLPSED